MTSRTWCARAWESRRREERQEGGSAKGRSATVRYDGNLFGKAHLHFEAPRLARLLQLLGEGVADELDNLVLVFKADLALGRVNIDVDFGRVDLERQVDEGIRALGEQGSVEAFESALEGSAVDEAVCERMGQLSKGATEGDLSLTIDEEEVGPFLRSIVGAAEPSLGLDSQLYILHRDLHQLLPHSLAVMQSNIVVDGGAERGVHVGGGSVGLLAHHRDAGVVDRVLKDDGDDARVLVGGRAKGLEARGSVVEEVLDLRGEAVSGSAETNVDRPLTTMRVPSLPAQGMG